MPGVQPRAARPSPLAQPRPATASGRPAAGTARSAGATTATIVSGPAARTNTAPPGRTAMAAPAFRPSPMLANRMARELRMLEAHSPPGVVAWPEGDSVTELRAQIAVCAAVRRG